MTNNISAARLIRIGPKPDGNQCALEFETADGQKGSLEFPIDQVEELLALLLQVERQQVERSEDGQAVKSVLLTDDVEVSLQPKTQTVLLDFQVDKKRFAFAIPREQAVNLAKIIFERLPSH